MASIGPHVSTISLVILLWLIVGRLKRVEVQVVQGDQETTYSMFKKLKHLMRFYLVFISATLAFQFPLLVSNYRIVEKFDYTDYHGE